jgi:hypothetical protein
MKTKSLMINGAWIENCQYIGKGLFCKAYKKDNQVFLICQGDYSKECIALFAQQNLRHMPKIERCEDIGDNQVFKMPYYTKLTKKAYPKAYAQYKALLKTMGQRHLVGYNSIYSMTCKLFELGERHLAACIQDLINAFSNYCSDSMVFEVPLCNVGVNQKGELILRDCLADSISIQRKRKGKI